jgi:glycosyltransferase involved in cell wall biosynthesis
VGRIRALANALRRDRVDIVHAFLYQANPYAWLAARLARTPHLVTSARNCQTLGRVRDWANRVAFRASDAIICNGGAVRDFIVERYAAPANKCVVIHNGVDLARFTPLRDARGGRRRRLVLGIGRLVPQKDFGLFIEAAALLRRGHADVSFAIVGDGPQRVALERHVGQAGLAGTFAFLGERQDVPDLLRDADVLWLSSQWEGLPNVVLEAAACGTPVVARDTGATREIVSHGVTGYLVSERDPAVFAAHTEGLLSDPALLDKMGEAARHVAEEHFSLSRMVASTEDLYRRVAAGRGWPVTEPPSRGSVSDDPTAVMRDRILTPRVLRGPRSRTHPPFSS